MTEKEMFSKRFSEAINDRTIKQKELASRIGCTEGTISKYLNLSAKEMPNAGLLRRIAKELQVSVDWLLGLTDQKGIGNGLSLRDIAQFLMACIDTPALNAELVDIHQNEFCYDSEDGYEPSCEERSNTYQALIFSEWHKNDDAFTGNHMLYAGQLNGFLKAYTVFRKLYYDGVLTEDLYNTAILSVLNRLSTAPIAKI